MLNRIKRIRSHVGHSRFLAECADTHYIIPRQADIPSPYRYSPDHQVYGYKDGYIIIVETAHRCFDVFAVPPELLRSEPEQIAFRDAARAILHEGEKRQVHHMTRKKMVRQLVAYKRAKREQKTDGTH